MGVLVILAGAIPLIFLFLLWKYSYWYRRGVPQGDPHKLFGDLNEIYAIKTPYWKHYLNLRRKFPDKPFYGIYVMGSPYLFVHDEEMLKDIFLKKFNSFGSNGFEVPEDLDPIISRDPFCQPKGERWKETRTSFSSLMTPGRLRGMISDMTLVANETVDYLKEQKHESGKGNGANIKSISSRAMTSLLIRLTLSLDAGVFKEGENPFLDAEKKLFEHMMGVVFAMVFTLSPKVAKLLGMSFLPQSAIDFYAHVVHEQLEYRKINAITRDDILDIIIKKSQGSNVQENASRVKERTIQGKDGGELEALATIIMFITEGFETTSTNISTAIAELARHPEIQETLRQQILSQCPLGKHITEEVINGIPLLQNVLLESIRLYSPAMILQRLATENVTLEAKTGEKISLKTGERLRVPVYLIHRDPERFPDPEKFDPDRFADENQRRFLLSFGDGPRQCPGQRFAAQAMKIILATILREFKLELSPKTKFPLEPENNEHLFSLREVWVRFVPV